MTRISDKQISTQMINDILKNRRDTQKFGEEISSGYKVSIPGDSKQSGTVAEFRDTLTKVEGYKSRIGTTEAFLNFQESVLGQVSDLLARAKELATQGANETLSEDERSFLAKEALQLREHLVNLANSKWQGKYVFSGAADNVPAYSRTTDFTNPNTNSLTEYRYAYNNNPGSTTTRTVQVTDDVSIRTNTAGNQLFDTAVYALERLGRALDGYQTLPAPPAAPDGTGNAYVFPQDFTLQTQDIIATIDLIDTAREDNIMTERTDLAGRMRRLETADAVVSETEVTAKEVLSRLQDADLVVSGSNLAKAQTALDASLTVSSILLKQSILDFL